MTAYWNGGWMFNTDVTSAYSLFNSVASSNTRINLRIWHGDSTLQSIFPWSHTYKSGSSLSSITSLASESPGAPTLYYDIEHWSSTPLSEQSNPIGSIAQAASIVHSHGKLFGATPDGRFLGGIRGCTYNIANGIVSGVNWQNVDYLNIQAQGLAEDSNCGAGNVTKFTAFVKQVVSIVRAQNPNISISAQVSLRDSVPTTAVKAIASIENAGVNDIYVAYQTSNCSTCTLANLTYVMNHLGP